MLTTRRAAALFTAALVASGLAILSPVLTTSASAAETLVDGTFEAAVGNPPVSPGWTVSDSEQGTPICTPTFCSSPPAGVAPHGGNNYARFGGTDVAGHTASIQQPVTLPQGSATLAFWFANPEVSLSGTQARLDVRIDGKLLMRLFEGDFNATYVQLDLDISEFADGGSHTLAFEYLNGAVGANSMVVDDVSIDAVAGPPVVNANPASLGPIPDAPGCTDYVGGNPRDVTFTVAGRVGKPTNVGVRMTFGPAHTYAGDVVATLIAPDGRRTTIFGAMDDYSDSNDLVGPYLFTDAADIVPTIERASLDSPDAIVPPGHYRAFENGSAEITPAFADLGDVNGTWTLRLRDLCDQDTGSVSQAALYLTTDGVAPDKDGDGVPDATDECPAKPGPKPSGCPDTTAPDTDIINPPAKGISKSLKVPFGFVSNETGATFLCSLDGATYVACANPTTLTVAPGVHTFRVKARDAAGNIDPYPASSTFTAYDCPTLQAAVTKLAKRLKEVKKAIKTVQAQLEKAKASGDDDLAKELTKKLAKLETKKVAIAKKLTKAKTAAAPCKA
jgi:hypothetical protein